MRVTSEPERLTRLVFWALLKYQATGHVKREEWPTPQARALSIVALGDYVDVLEEGQSA